MFIILIYAIIRFRKVGALINIIGFNVLAQLLFLSILAITRLPVNTLTMIGSVVIYVVTTLIVFNNLEVSNQISKKEEKNK